MPSGSTHFAEYMAILGNPLTQVWTEWDDEHIRLRLPEALEGLHRQRLADQIDYHRPKTQYLFSNNGTNPKNHANENGIEIVETCPFTSQQIRQICGPIPHFFKTDEQGRPVLWLWLSARWLFCNWVSSGAIRFMIGMPSKDGFTWWLFSSRESFKLYDMVRIDHSHFIGFASLLGNSGWEETAVNGYRVRPLVLSSFAAIKAELGDLNIIAEDLGSVTDKVIQPGIQLVSQAWKSHLPFDPEGDSIEASHNHTNNNVVAHTGNYFWQPYHQGLVWGGDGTRSPWLLRSYSKLQTRWVCQSGHACLRSSPSPSWLLWPCRICWTWAMRQGWICQIPLVATGYGEWPKTS